jgi:NAD(P)-dependent dehydrogenase (short-subunit alcohol dehydrogenase family)
MKDFGGKLAVITGGGTGMGRALARQLVAEGCDVATCDVLDDNLAETRVLCEQEAPQGRVITTHHCDVSDEAEVQRFRDAVVSDHGTDHIDLLFNNAGVGGGASIVDGDREDWERTFNICWYGVYYNTRAFMPLLVASQDAHLINTSSVNGFWATLGPQSSHTAYSAAKFAVKGFSEALITDLANNAPHVKVSVVMPGHIGTSIAINSGRILNGRQAEELSDDDIVAMRKRWASLGMVDEDTTDEQIQVLVGEMGRRFRDDAPTTAGQAASIILDGVREERWRILVGNDAHRLDELVREDPESAYTPEFMIRLRETGEWGLG